MSVHFLGLTYTIGDDTVTVQTHQANHTDRNTEAIMQVMSTSQAAKKLQCSKNTVLRLIESGQLSASRLTETGHWRIRQEDLEAYAEQRGVALLAREK